MKDYNLQLKIRNNRILSRLREAGYKTVGAFCRVNEFRANDVGDLVNLKKSPLKENGDFKKTVVDIAEVLGCLPEELFSEDQLVSLGRNTFEAEVSRRELERLPSYDPETLLLEFQTSETINDVLGSVLSEREQRVLRQKAGLDPYDREHTWGEIGEDMGVTCERVRQIATKAMRKLRCYDFRNEAALLELLDDQRAEDQRREWAEKQRQKWDSR